MELIWERLVPWGQARARANARSASTALARARVEREEVHRFVARDLAGRAEVLEA
jgi:hypothetical protein